MTNDNLLQKIIKIFDNNTRPSFALVFSENISVPEYITLAISTHMQTTKEIIYVSDIVKEFQASAPAISKHLRSCEAKGYIERITDKDDRRNTIIIITEYGQKVFNKTKSELSVFKSHLLNKICIEEFMEWIEKTTYFKTVINDTIEELRIK